MSEHLKQLGNLPLPEIRPGSEEQISAGLEGFGEAYDRSLPGQAGPEETRPKTEIEAIKNSIAETGGMLQHSKAHEGAYVRDEGEALAKQEATPRTGEPDSRIELGQDLSEGRRVDVVNARTKIGEAMKDRRPHEAVAFFKTPDQMSPEEPKTRTQRVLGAVGLGRFKQARNEQSESIPTTIENPITGEPEQSVEFRYSFATPTSNNSNYGGEKHLEPETNEAIARAGNGVGAEIQFAAQLPESLATHLQDLIKENPESARDIIDSFVESKGDNEAWKTATDLELEKNGASESKPAINRRRPSYDELPNDWKIDVFDDKPKVTEDSIRRLPSQVSVADAGHEEGQLRRAA